MGNQFDFVKDVSIAFLSASALLLTLVLGIISPSLSSLAVKVDVQIATLSLYTTAGASALFLTILAKYDPEQTDISKDAWKGLVLQSIPFLIALAFLATAIIVKTS